MTESCSVSAVVIPARLASSRLPRKLLLDATGKPLLQHTFESAETARHPRSVHVATEDMEIARAVSEFGGECLMTARHDNGTARVIEVAVTTLRDVEIFVNVQGDEPEIDGTAIDQLILSLEQDPELQMATLVAPIRDAQDLHDPSCVKVVADHDGQAMYFSRSPIPYPRGGVRPEMFCDPPAFLQHIGVYAYKRELLLRMGAMPESSLSGVESLEQLAMLQARVPIKVCMLDEPTCGIDTPEDYERFVASQRKQAAA